MESSWKAAAANSREERITFRTDLESSLSDLADHAGGTTLEDERRRAAR
jgi:hypothetical protein